MQGAAMPAHLKLHPSEAGTEAASLYQDHPAWTPLKIEWQCSFEIRVKKLEEHVRQLHWPRSVPGSIPFRRAMSPSVSSFDAASLRRCCRISMPASGILPMS